MEICRLDNDSKLAINKKCKLQVWVVENDLFPAAGGEFVLKFFVCLTAWTWWQTCFRTSCHYHCDSSWHSRGEVSALLWSLYAEPQVHHAECSLIWLPHATGKNHRVYQPDWFGCRKGKGVSYIRCLLLLLSLLFYVSLYSRFSLNGHLCETDTSVKRTPGVGPCRCLCPLFDSV